MNEVNKYFTISNVSKQLNIPSHVLRFWEKKFNMINPKKSETGRRYYSSDDVKNIEIIKELLYDKGYTITGAIKFMKNSKNEDIDANHNVKNTFLLKKINDTSDLLFKAKEIINKYS